MTDPSANLTPARKWRVALDTGGTFTDLVATSPDGSVHRAKIPSDGSLVASVRDSCDGARLRFVAAGGVALPDGFLAGWRVRGERFTAAVLAPPGAMLALA
ncbi:MAG: hydantoinase/oxoprolinase N-terminal domain-containing protein, partial [Phycisphaerales bacterium]